MLARGLIILLLVLTLGTSVIHFRTQQARATRNVQRLRAERAELLRETWELQARLARLRTPQRIQERVENWQLNVQAAWPATNHPRSMAYALR